MFGAIGSLCAGAVFACAFVGCANAVGFTRALCCLVLPQITGRARGACVCTIVREFSIPTRCACVVLLEVAGMARSALDLVVNGTIGSHGRDAVVTGAGLRDLLATPTVVFQLFDNIPFLTFVCFGLLLVVVAYSVLGRARSLRLFLANGCVFGSSKRAVALFARCRPRQTLCATLPVTVGAVQALAVLVFKTLGAVATPYGTRHTGHFVGL